MERNLLEKAAHKITDILTDRIFYTYCKSKLEEDILFIRNAGVENIKEFKTELWHHGFSYYTGLYRGKKVFIKVDNFFHFLENDVRIYEIFCRKIENHLVDIIDYYFEKKKQFIIFEFFEGKPLTEKDLNEKFLEIIKGILEVFEEYRFVHRDFRLDNFLLKKDKITLIDFTFSASKKINLKELDKRKFLERQTLRRLGFYKPSLYQWDDYFSIYTILNKVKDKEKKEIIEKYKSIFKSRIGKNTYKV